MGERRVVATLEADSRERISGQAAPADRTAVVARIDEDVVGQLKQPVAESAIELSGCRLRIAAGVQVGATHVPDEERVAGEDEPRLIGPASLVGDDVGVVRGSVAGRRDRTDERVSELDDLAVSEFDMVEVDFRPCR